MQTTIITLCLISFVSGLFSLYQSARLRVAKNTLARKKAALLCQRTDRDDRRAMYYIGENKYGYPTVYRRTFPDGKPIDTTIKVFDTDNMEYNHNCAVELYEKLVERLCYD